MDSTLADPSATRFTATELKAIFFQCRRITSTIYCSILLECSLSRQMLATRIQAHFTDTELAANEAATELLQTATEGSDNASSMHAYKCLFQRQAGLVFYYVHI